MLKCDVCWISSRSAQDKDLVDPHGSLHASVRTLLFILPRSVLIIPIVHISKGAIFGCETKANIVVLYVGCVQDSFGRRMVTVPCCLLLARSLPSILAFNAMAMSKY